MLHSKNEKSCSFYGTVFSLMSVNIQRKSFLESEN